MPKMNEEIYAQFSKRQIDIQRKNLVQICRLTVKTLIDKASITNIDDDCEELINFCAAIEQILTYRQKAQRTWYGIEEVRPFWDFIQTACRYLPNNCITSIATLENVKSPIGKGRAWIRCVLMEKRLSEYLSNAILQTKIVRRFYQDGSVILSEDINVLCGVLLGLNSIDFSFCLKGQHQELKSPLFIDYTPYLIFQQSEESAIKDFEELEQLSTDAGRTSSSVVRSSDDSWEVKFRELERTHKTIKEQKGYLEELLRMREHQFQDLQRKHQNLCNVFKKFDSDSKKDRLQMENVVIELQHQLTSVTTKCEGVSAKYEALVSKLKSGFIDLEIVNPERSSPIESSNQLDYRSTDVCTSNIPESAAKLVIPGTRGLQHEMKAETESMLVMAGSFSSEKSSEDTSNRNFTKNDENNKASDADGAIVINFPENDQQSLSSTETSSIVEESITGEQSHSKTDFIKQEENKKTTEPGSEKSIELDDSSSPNEDLQATTGNNIDPANSALEPSREDNGSEPERDTSTSSPEILQPSEEENSNGSESSVNEDQYDLVSDDLSKFGGASEENENATG
ncbi:RUN domain-containing protein 3B-like [Mytilus californianus]|uniref:RUN domain-containing protein 3B-like n=1 Tax=Mytilus californianus TaxID=6549 RepID=UPI0022471229|nr:RUN domain-containing protein 3B-like [Mytilus californianus]